MNQKKQSKEELFLLKLHEIASAKEDPQTEVDRYEVGQAIGVNSKAVDNVVQLLTKNGLTKKSGEKMVYLSDFGLNYIKDHLS